MTSTTCDIQPELLEKLKKFRFNTKSKGSSAFIIRIDRDKLLIEEDEVHDNISIDELREELPESRSRYIVLSYEFKHKDGRVSYPLVLIYYSPTTVKTEENMLYASSKAQLQQAASLSKIFDVQDKEELTEEALHEWLKSTMTRP